MGAEESPLVRVCALLNAHEAAYLIVGARACILHGYIRTTEDVDILVPEDAANHARVIAALSELEDGAARELTAQDLIDNVVVKVADEVEVDISTRAWKVTYAVAAPRALRAEIDGVAIPYVDLETLIQSKLTFREQDRVDVEFLRRLAASR